MTLRRDLTGLEARTLLAKADLRGLRTRAGITLTTLAEALGVSPHTVCNWERRRGYPRGWVLIGYARVIAGLARHEAVTKAIEEERRAA